MDIDILKILGLEEDKQENKEEQPVQEEKKEEKQPEAGQETKQSEPVQQPAPQQTQPQVQQPGQQAPSISHAVEQAFMQMFGRKPDLKNMEDVIVVNQLAQQIQRQQAVMDYLRQAVDQKFDAWLTEKMATLPYGEVAKFNQAIQNGDLEFVRQWIEAKKKEFLGENTQKQQQEQKQTPPQAEEKDFIEASNTYADLLSPEELEAIKDLI